MRESTAEREEGWKVVVNRRRMRGRAEPGKEWITIFFRNFPESCTSEDLRGGFEEVGRVEDIFIPTKKDKMGYRLGFVRFRRSGDEDCMIEKLNKIWIESFIIRAWKPRFERSKVLSG